jgi:serine/threonine protein kinase
MTLPAATLPPGRPDETLSLSPAAADTSAPPLPTIPGYEVLSELGRGGMGVVYQARQVALKRIVALKMILLGHVADPQVAARFRVEAESVARLRHPNVVQVYEIGSCQGLPFFSLEFVEGGSLAERLRGEPQPPREAARLVQTLARAVHAAHEQGVVHRDLKPANVLLGPQPGSSAADHWLRSLQPKITDFGLAKQLDDDGSQTRSGDVMGSPSYMAPEQGKSGRRRMSTHWARSCTKR